MRHPCSAASAGVALILASVFHVATAAPPSYKPGDRVECDSTQTGRYDAGTVVPFTNTDLDQSGRWYRVKLDKDKIPNSTAECMTTRLRPLSSPPATKQNDPTPAVVPSNSGNPKPPPEKPRNPSTAPASAPASMPARTVPKSLPGTAWKIDFGRGVTGTVFLFCRTGRWEIVPASGSIGAIGKSYEVSAQTLTTVNRDDGKVEKYQMAWKGDVLELFDGKVTIRLHYNGETRCK